MLKRLLTRVEVGLARLLGRVRMGYYHMRLKDALSCLKYEGADIGPACPHEVRIPREVVGALTSHEKSMLTNALLYSARPYGATLHECRRCYSLTRTIVKSKYLGY